jgi:hypothetical protein
MSGVAETPGMTGVSIDGCAVLNPLRLPPGAAAAGAEHVIAAARAAQATTE